MKTRILLHGALGVMGENIISMAKNNDEYEIVAGKDIKALDKDLKGFPIYDNFSDIAEDFDVIIDFSNKDAIDDLLDFVLEIKKPLVLCTTGLSDEQLKKLEEISEETAVLRSSNMSIGINLIDNILAEISSKLKNIGYDIEIVEAHHRRKKDAPSGTAIMLADTIDKSIKENSRENMEYVFERASKHEKRSDNEIGISSIRGGSISGIHEVLFAGEDEIISIKHEAGSRRIFAKGALTAATFLKDKKSGLYSMKEVLG